MLSPINFGKLPQGDLANVLPVILISISPANDTFQAAINNRQFLGP